MKQESRLIERIKQMEDEGRISHEKARRLETAYMVKKEMLKRDWYDNFGKREPIRDMGLYKFVKGDYDNANLSNLSLKRAYFSYF